MTTEAEVRARRLPEEGAGAQERRQSLGAGRGQEVESPAEPQENMQTPCQHPDFSPVKPISGFRFPEL